MNSKPFDRYYELFVDDAINGRVRSVETGETPTHRTVTLAGHVRFSVHKKTRLLTRQTMASGEWTSTSLPSFPLLGKKAGWLALIKFAWAGRMRTFLPKAPPAGESWFSPGRDSFRSVEDRLKAACEAAALRRIGGGRQQICVAEISRAFWHHLLDRQVVSLAQAFFGTRASTRDYNYAARWFKPLADRYAETPNLAPVMGSYLAGGPQRLRRPPLDLLVLARERMFRVGVHEAGEGAGPFRLTPAAWRYIAHSPKSFVQLIVRRHPDSVHYFRYVEAPDAAFQYEQAQFLCLLNVVATVQIRLPYSFLKWVLHLPTRNFAKDPAGLGRFIRLAGLEAANELRSGTLKAFIKRDLRLVWDWMDGAGCGPDRLALCAIEGFDSMWETWGFGLAPVPRNATWSSVMRAQRNWHADRAQREAAEEARVRAYDAAYQIAWERRQLELDKKCWPSALGELVVDDVKVTPLVTGAALRNEGATMDHCVWNYLNDCVEGISRIFHMSRGDEQATLELRRRTPESSRWLICQVFGPRNAHVSAAMDKAAERVLVAYRKADRPRR